MTAANDRLLVFDDEPALAVHTTPTPTPTPPAPARSPQPPLSPDEWAALSATDRIALEVGAAAARLQQQKEVQPMAEQTSPAVQRTPTPPAPAAAAAQGATGTEDDSLVYGAQETMRVETVIYRAFVELEDGLARAIPAGVQLAPASMNAVVRRIQRRTLLADAQEDARDQRALADAEALRAPTGRLQVIQQDPPLALPAPGAALVPPAEQQVMQAQLREAGAQPAQRQSIITLDDLQRNPERFVAVGTDDARVQRLLAARDLQVAAAAATQSRWTPMGCLSACIVYGIIGTMIIIVLANISFTAPYVRSGGGWLKAHTIDIAITRLGRGTPGVVAIQAGDPNEFVFKQAPSITCGQFTAALAHTPIVSEGVAACEKIVRAGYEPAILAAMAKLAMENTSPEAQKRWQPIPLGGYNLFAMSSADQTPIVYSSYTEAFDAFVDALDTTYAGQGVTDLASFIPLNCVPGTCDAAAFLKNTQGAVRAIRATPDPAGAATLGATPAPDAPAAGATPAPTTSATGAAPVAEQASGPLRVTVSSLTIEDDGNGGKRTRMLGMLMNIGDKDITIAGNAFSFLAPSAPGNGTFSISEDVRTTMGPGQLAPLNLTVPVSAGALQLLINVQPDITIQLDLRK